jgi:hypothetical protein
MAFPKRSPKGLTSAKAEKILSDGAVKGNPLTSKQKGFFGARAGGAPMKPSGMASLGGDRPAPRNPPGRKSGGKGY